MPSPRSGNPPAVLGRPAGAAQPARFAAPHGWSVALCLVAALLAGTLLALPERLQRAEALVLVEGASPDAVAPAFDGDMLGRVAAGSLPAIDRDDTGASRLIGGLFGEALDGLGERPGAPRDTLERSDDGAAATAGLAARADIRALPGGSLVAIGVADSDPDKAVQSANALAQAWIDTHAIASTAAVVPLPPVADTAALTDRLDAARRKIDEYRRNGGTLVAPPPLSATQRQSLAVRLVLTRAKVAELEARLDQARRISPTAPHPLDTPALAALRRAFADMSARQARLLAELGPRHPLVGSLDDEMASAARQIDGEIARISDATSAELASTKAGGEALSAAIAVLDEEAGARDRAEAGLLSLQAEVEAAQTALEVALRNAAARTAAPPLPAIRLAAPATTAVRLGSALPEAMLFAALVGLLAGSAVLLAVPRLRS